MKRFKHHIKEALDKPYPVKLVNTDVGGYYYEFKTDQGVTYVISIASTSSPWEEHDPETAVWEIEFENYDRQTHLTKSGDEFRVFASVASAVKSFMQKEKPNHVMFRGAKGGKDGDRRGLYGKFVKKLGRVYNMKMSTLSGNKNTATFRLDKK